MNITKRENTKSTIYSYLNVIPFALIPLIWIIDFPVPAGLGGKIAQSVVVTISKDFLSGVVFVMAIILTGRFKAMIDLLKRKEGWLVALAGIFGGPIGYVLYNTAFLYAGPSYGHIFTSMEPIILVVSGMLLFKRKYNLNMILGIVLTVASLSALIIGKSFSEMDFTHVIIGALLGIGGSAAWALETMLFDKAFSGVKDDKDATMKLLTIKMIAALTFGFVVMMPLMSTLATSNDKAWDTDAALDYKLFGDVFTHGKYLWRFFAAGTMIMAARYMYFYAIDRKGGTYVAVIYNLTVIVTPIASMIYFAFTKEWVGSEDLFSTGGIVLLSISPFLIAGVTLVTLNRPKIERYEK